MNNEIDTKLFALLKGAESIALTTHLNSDGDGMVACLALQKILLEKALPSTIVTDGEDLGRYQFLMRDARVLPFTPSMQYDVCIVLDCNSYDRLGQRRALVDKARTVVVLDHHVIEHNPILADLQLVDYSFPSVGTLIWQHMKQVILSLDDEIRRYVADCVYVTILNDGNNFSNANTNARMFSISAELCEHGIQPHLLHMAYLQNHSAKEMMYVGNSLATIRLHNRDQILFLHSDLALARKLQVNPADYMSVTRWVQGVSGLKAIAYFREDEPEKWKISLRSLVVNVQEIAAKFGGGGHRKASGLSLQGSLAEVQEIILQELNRAISAL
jgi:phosphoesterase RecJ-like protein